MCLENIHHLFKIYLPRFQRITICRFTTRFTKNCNLQGFKELQYADLQLDLQRTTTWKVVRYFFKSFEQVLRALLWFYLDLCLICWFTSLCFIPLDKRQCHEIVLITHTDIFSKQEVLRRRAARGSSWENKC